MYIYLGNNTAAVLYAATRYRLPHLPRETSHFTTIIPIAPDGGCYGSKTRRQKTRSSPNTVGGVRFLNKQQANAKKCHPRRCRLFRSLFRCHKGRSNSARNYSYNTSPERLLQTYWYTWYSVVYILQRAFCVLRRALFTDKKLLAIKFNGPRCLHDGVASVLELVKPPLTPPKHSNFVPTCLKVGRYLTSSADTICRQGNYHTILLP